MGLPVISVEFKKLATTAVTRSTWGILAVILQDDTSTFDYKTYTTLEDVTETEYTVVPVQEWIDHDDSIQAPLAE